MNHWITTILVLAYFIILLLIGYLTSRKESAEGFLIADRKLKWPTLIATLAGGYAGGGFLVLIASWAFKYGFSVMWVFIGAVLGFLVLIAISAKLKKLSDEKQFYTISDYIYLTFGSKTGLLATLSIFIYFLTWLLLQFIGGGIILSTLLGLQYHYAVLAIGVVILIYLLLSGFKAVVRTDFFQFLIMIFLGLIIMRIGTKGLNLSGDQLNLMSGMGISGALGFLIMGLIVTVLSGDVWQRIYAAKDRKHLNIGLIGAAIAVCLLGAITASIGLWAKAHHPTIAADAAFTTGLQHMLPASLFGIGLLIVLSSIMSTADTIIFAMSMNLSRDVLFHFKRLNKIALVSLTRISVIIIVLLSIIISLTTKDVSDIGLMAAAVLLPLGPAVIGSFMFKPKRIPAFISILFGFISFLALAIFYGITDMSVPLPFLVSLITFIPLQIFCKI